MLLLLVPALSWAQDGRLVDFPAYCFIYKDFLKEVDKFQEVPIMIGLKETAKDEQQVVISVLYNRQEDSFSIVQFNKEVGCFISVGKKLKFNIQGLKPEDLK